MIYIINQSTKPDESENERKYEAEAEEFRYEFAHVTTLTAIMCSIFNSINVDVQNVIAFDLIRLAFVDGTTRIIQLSAAKKESN